LALLVFDSNSSFDPSFDDPSIITIAQSALTDPVAGLNAVAHEFSHAYDFVIGTYVPNLDVSNVDANLQPGQQEEANAYSIESAIVSNLEFVTMVLSITRKTLPTRGSFLRSAITMPAVTAILERAIMRLAAAWTKALFMVALAILGARLLQVILHLMIPLHNERMKNARFLAMTFVAASVLVSLTPVLGMPPPYLPPVGPGWKPYRSATIDGALTYRWRFIFTPRSSYGGITTGGITTQSVGFDRISLDEENRRSSLDDYVVTFVRSEEQLGRRVQFVKNLHNGNEHVARLVEVRETDTDARTKATFEMVRLYAFVKVRSAVYIGRYERRADQPVLKSALASLHSLCLKADQCTTDNQNFFD